MAIQMTREEYRQKYGKEPLVSNSALDTKPAPIRMTRAEYDSIYGKTEPKAPGLGKQLLNRASDVFNAVTSAGEKTNMPGRSQLRVAGAVTGAAADVIGAVASPVINKVVDTVSDSPTIQNIASSEPVSKAVDAANAVTDTVQKGWEAFEGANPNIAQDIRDTVNVLTFGTIKKASSDIAKSKPVTTIKNLAGTDERTILGREQELFDIENNYVKTRNANEYSKDAGAASRRRIASTDVLVDAVDAEGTIRTKLPGGAIDKYKAQTINGFEDVVRKNLEATGEKVDLKTIETALITEIYRSKLDGGDLVSALNGVKRELKGLSLRAQGDEIDLYKVHDAKISTTNNINYQTPPEQQTYRKAVAAAYRKLVEQKSTKFNVKEVNDELSKFYDDIDRLERLDGRKVKGGRLGKYFAQTAGTLIGMGAGAVAGPLGSAVGGVVGGEAASLIKGTAMSRSFGKATGKTAPRNEILERARLRVPDEPVTVPKDIPRTKEVETLERDIQKNVADQAKAIQKGDFTLVAALKEIYQALVAELKRVIEMAKKDKRGMVNFGAPMRAEKPNPLFEEAKKYKSAEEFMKAHNRIISTSENDTLKFYNEQSQREWLGTVPPKDGMVAVYRATTDGASIKSGDYITNNLDYAKQHISNNLQGKGRVSTLKVGLDEMLPADAPKEFWYRPKGTPEVTHSQLTDIWKKANEPQSYNRGNRNTTYKSSNPNKTNTIPSTVSKSKSDVKVPKGITDTELIVIRDFTDMVNGAWKPSAKEAAELREAMQEIADKYKFESALKGDKALSNEGALILDAAKFSETLP